MTAKVADSFGNVNDVAFTVTVVTDATFAGALYVAFEVVVGPSVPEPDAGVSDQVTPAFELSFATCARMARACPSPSACAVAGVKATEWKLAGVPVQPWYTREQKTTVQKRKCARLTIWCRSIDLSSKTGLAHGE